MTINAPFAITHGQGCSAGLSFLRLKNCDVALPLKRMIASAGASPSLAPGATMGGAGRAIIVNLPLRARDERRVGVAQGEWFIIDGGAGTDGAEERRAGEPFCFYGG